jgi:hypothetical protein
MQEFLIKDLASNVGKEVCLKGWASNKREMALDGANV